VLKGFNYRMEAIQGALLRVKLRRLDVWIEARRAHARRYDALLSEARLRTPESGRDIRHVYHLYAVRLEHRDQIHIKLTDRGIQTGIHYPIPVHLEPAYADLGYKVGDFPQAEAAAREVLSLPLYPELPAKHQDVVNAALREITHVLG
jgi:dTDP-4-amino-4,6-dideoxygalactose transaminase